MTKYKLSSLLPEQARVISNALEFYARIRTGQINELISMFRRSIQASVKIPAENLDEAETLLRQVKKLLFPDLSPDASYGIRSAPDEISRTCYDIHQVVRHRLAWDEDPISPEGFPKGFRTVNHDDPWECGKFPLPRMDKEESPSTGKVTILFGSAQHPGPVVEVEDSLETIAVEIKKEFSLGKFSMATVRAPNWCLVIDDMSVNKDGLIKLKPAQR